MSSTPKSNRWSKPEIGIIASIPLTTAAWAVVVGLSGKDVNLFDIEWDFQRTALLGDSFGVVGALMATAAAAFTFLTLRGERAENARLRSLEAERDRADRKREAETTFFQLLNLRNSILERVRDKERFGPKEVVHGLRAIELIAKFLAFNVNIDPRDGQRLYDDYWPKIEGEVGHYLRFTYHIIRFAAANFHDDKDRYGYVRLLRAQLSNAELELIALNSAYGAGKPRMKVFVEHFAFLHNLPDSRIDELRLRSLFAASAFDSSAWTNNSPDPDTSDHIRPAAI